MINNDAMKITQFLLTHLMRGATKLNGNWSALNSISTHTPHARCNNLGFLKKNCLDYFYSQTSCEVQPNTEFEICADGDFYSHTSCEVQHEKQRIENILKISTHTPHARCNKYGTTYQELARISTHTPHARCNHW